MSAGEDFYCEAYGRDGAQVGAVCFMVHVSGLCGSAEECASLMGAERERVWHTLTASDNPEVIEVLDALREGGASGPQDLLRAHGPGDDTP